MENKLFTVLARQAQIFQEAERCFVLHSINSDMWQTKLITNTFTFNFLHMLRWTLEISILNYDTVLSFDIQPCYSIWRNINILQIKTRSGLIWNINFNINVHSPPEYCSVISGQVWRHHIWHLCRVVALLDQSIKL